MSAGNDPVTQDGLRAALAEFKYDLSLMFAAAARVDALEARYLSPEAVKQMIREALQDSEARGWTRRDRLMAIGGFLIVVLTLGLSFYTAFFLGK